MNRLAVMNADCVIATGKLPLGVTNVLFVWERKNKVIIAEAEPVNADKHAAFWVHRQDMKQVGCAAKAPLVNEIHFKRWFERDWV